MKDVQCISGMANSYRHRVPKMAEKDRPLNALTRKDKATGRAVALIGMKSAEKVSLN